MKRKIFFMGIIAVVFTACLKDDTGEKRNNALAEFDTYISELENKGVNLTEAGNGVYYELITSPIGITPEVEDLMEVEVTARVIGGNIFFTTSLDTAEKYDIVDENYVYGPYRFFYGLGFTYGFYDAVSKMGEGAELNIYVPTNRGYDYVDYSPLIPEFSNLVYQVKIINVAPEPDDFETGNLYNYLLENNINIEDTTEAGIYFEWIETSTGDTVEVNDNVTIRYKGYFLDGRVFDEKTGDDTYGFMAGASNIIDGFNSGILNMTEGSKARFIIPYKYAYGAEPETDYYFPPYSTVIFDVELVDIE